MPKGPYKQFNALSKRQQNRIIKRSILNPPPDLQPIVSDDEILHERQDQLPNRGNTYTSEGNQNFLEQDKLDQPVCVEEVNLEVLDDDTEWFDLFEFETFLEEDADDGVMWHDAISQIDEEQCNDDSSDVNDFSWTDLKDGLRIWSEHENVNQATLRSLLGLLKNHSCFKELPIDPRTILATPRDIPGTIDVSGGQYHHFGLKEGIVHELKSMSSKYNIPDLIEIQLNFDGVPISKSSGAQFWPILAKMLNVENSTPFVVGIFYSQSKPKCTKLFEEMVDEVNMLYEAGIDIKNQNHSITVRNMICDAPARAFVAQVKGHTGNYGCSKCVQRGKNIRHRQTFPECNSQLRTDVSFNRQVDEDHHIGTSHLKGIKNFGMVSQIPLDYMHLICLGIMRKMFTLWLAGSLLYRLSGHKISLINNRLAEIKSYICREFARKPRSLREVARWKATEFRQFLLYTGPFILQEILSDKLYKHFLLLHYAVRLLLRPRLVGELINYANQLLIMFVNEFMKIYGPEHVTYNVHNLIHVCEDVKKFGSLDQFSAFPYENYLQYLKGLIRKAEKPLEQVKRRIHETRSLPKTTEIINDFNEVPKLTKSPVWKQDKNVLGCSGPFYSKVQLKDFMINTDIGNNCVVLQTGEIVLVNHICTENGVIFIVGQSFTKVENFYEYPHFSREVGIYKTSKLSQLQKWQLSDVQKKAICIPMSRHSYYIAELLHLDPVLEVQGEYVVIEFIETNEIEPALSAWVKPSGDGFVLSWPGNQNHKHALSKKKNPEKSWKKYSVRILAYADTELKAREKCQNGENTSNLESDGERGRGQRKKIPSQKKRVIEEESDGRESDSDSSSTRTRNDIARNTPVPPPFPLQAGEQIDGVRSPGSRSRHRSISQDTTQTHWEATSNRSDSRSSQTRSPNILEKPSSSRNHSHQSTRSPRHGSTPRRSPGSQRERSPVLRVSSSRHSSPTGSPSLMRERSPLLRVSSSRHSSPRGSPRSMRERSPLLHVSSSRHSTPLHSLESQTNRSRLQRGSPTRPQHSQSQKHRKRDNPERCENGNSSRRNSQSQGSRRQDRRSSSESRNSQSSRDKYRHGNSSQRRSQPQSSRRHDHRSSSESQNSQSQRDRYRLGNSSQQRSQPQGSRRHDHRSSSESQNSQSQRDRYRLGNSSQQRSQPQGSRRHDHRSSSESQNSQSQQDRYRLGNSSQQRSQPQGSRRHDHRSSSESQNSQSQRDRSRHENSSQRKSQTQGSRSQGHGSSSQSQSDRHGHHTAFELEKLQPSQPHNSNGTPSNEPGKKRGGTATGVPRRPAFEGPSTSTSAPPKQTDSSNKSAVGQSALNLSLEQELVFPFNSNPAWKEPATVGHLMRLAKLLQKLFNDILARFDRGYGTQIERSEDISIPGIEFPMKQVDMFNSLEEKLQEKEVRLFLIQMMTDIGGKNPDDHIVRILQRQLSNKLAMQYNWEGRGLKKKIGTTSYIRTLKRAIKTAYQSSPPRDSQIESRVKNWLRHAKQRATTEENRQRDSQNLSSSESYHSDHSDLE